MSHDVFISYSTRDTEAAKKAYAALENAGICCWIAPDSIPTGKSYLSEIENAVASSHLLLLVFSSHSNTSNYCINEVDSAVEASIQIIPWRIEKCEQTGDMKSLLRRRHWRDAFEPPIEKHLEQLVADVKRLLPEENTIAATITPPQIVSPQTMQENEDKAKPDEETNDEPFDYTRETNRTEFLAACDDKDRAYFEQVLDYCQSNPRKTIIDWGSKGLSLKDRKERPLIWMFPTHGTSHKFRVQVRTGSYTAKETKQVTQLLSEEGIKVKNWRTEELPIEKMKDIINLLCRIKA